MIIRAIGTGDLRVGDHRRRRFRVHAAVGAGDSSVTASTDRARSPRPSAYAEYPGFGPLVAVAGGLLALVSIRPRPMRPYCKRPPYPWPPTCAQPFGCPQRAGARKKN